MPNLFVVDDLVPSVLWCLYFLLFSLVSEILLFLLVLCFESHMVSYVLFACCSLVADFSVCSFCSAIRFHLSLFSGLLTQLLSLSLIINLISFSVPYDHLLVSDSLSKSCLSCFILLSPPNTWLLVCLFSLFIHLLSFHVTIWS